MLSLDLLLWENRAISYGKSNKVLHVCYQLESWLSILGRKDGGKLQLAFILKNKERITFSRFDESAD